MSFLAPGWLVLAGMASAAVAAIHLIAWRLPRVESLPTARFVPDEPARRAARTVRLSDIALLALRIAIITAAGLALARPVFRPTPSGTASVIAVERYADTTVLRDSLRGIPRGDESVFVVFDTSAHFVDDEAAAIAAADSGSAPSLSVGLVAAIRKAQHLARDYESVRISLVSSLDRSAFDAATGSVRALWADSIRVIRLPLVPIPANERNVEVTASGDDDPVAAGVELASANGLLRSSVRVVRGALSPADSGEARGGRLVVEWPRALSAVNQQVDGVQANDATAIGYFIRSGTADSGRVVARWVDGTPAAVESEAGTGCIRKVGFDVPDVGDFTITPAFQRLAGELLASCGLSRSGLVAPDSLIKALADRPAEPSQSAAPDESNSPNRLAAGLMALAVLLAAGEIALRRRSFDRRVVEVAA